MGQASGLDWGLDYLRERIAASHLFPRAYARYLPLVADALVFFLRRLSAERLSRILTEQAAFFSSASAAERLVAVLHHSPALHKLGQVVARDRRLTGSFRKRLQTLESLSPRM